jgi:hypothetical protein
MIMPKAIPSWTTSDGQTHLDYTKSIQHELFLWLSKAGDNTVGARAIVEALTPEAIGPFADLLETLEQEFKERSQFMVVKA